MQSRERSRTTGSVHEQSFNQNATKIDHNKTRMLCKFFNVCASTNNLLRDFKITLKTDHANLYLNVLSPNKVLRWKLVVQEYDIDVEHIACVKNIVADSFSRLLDTTKVPIGDVVAISDEH